MAEIEVHTITWIYLCIYMIKESARHLQGTKLCLYFDISPAAINSIVYKIDTPLHPFPK